SPLQRLRGERANGREAERTPSAAIAAIVIPAIPRVDRARGAPTTGPPAHASFPNLDGVVGVMSDLGRTSTQSGFAGPESPSRAVRSSKERAMDFAARSEERR